MSECICTSHTSDSLLVNVNDKCPVHGATMTSDNKPQIPDDLKDPYLHCLGNIAAKIDSKWRSVWVKDLIERISQQAAELATLRAENARLKAPVSDEGTWVIKFEDPDRADEVFTGQGASHAALERYRVCCYSWTCHLLTEFVVTTTSLAPQKEEPHAE